LGLAILNSGSDNGVGDVLGGLTIHHIFGHSNSQCLSKSFELSNLEISDDDDLLFNFFLNLWNLLSFHERTTHGGTFLLLLFVSSEIIVLSSQLGQFVDDFSGFL
jgi:hypothetical protein